MDDTSYEVRTVAVVKRSTLQASIVLTLAFIVGVSTAYVAGSAVTNEPAVPVSFPAATPSTPVALSPVPLNPSDVLWVHEAQAATTSFRTGALVIHVPVTGSSTQRFVPFSGELLDGGRLSGDSAHSQAQGLLQGLPVVVSFTNDRPLSIFGYLAESPGRDGQDVTYAVSLVDAPGRSSTYSIGGDYDIPEVLNDVRVIIAGTAG